MCCSYYEWGLVCDGSGQHCFVPTVGDGILGCEHITRGQQEPIGEVRRGAGLHPASCHGCDVNDLAVMHQTRLLPVWGFLLELVAELNGPAWSDVGTFDTHVDRVQSGCRAYYQALAMMSGNCDPGCVACGWDACGECCGCLQP